MSKESTILLSTPTSSAILVTDKKKGAGYHKIADNLHTFVFQFTNWTGVVNVQATLSLYPGDNDWFSIMTVGTDGSTDFDDAYTSSVSGNFVWIRAICYCDEGEITQIRYNY
jgi:hypothetical protein